MPEKQSNFKIIFPSAMLGGLIVAAVWLAALTTGLVKVKSTSSGTTANKTSALPTAVDNTSGGKDDGSTVQRIYKTDGPGVVFIKAQISGDPQKGPFGLPVPQSQGEATGSGFVIDDQGYVLTNAHVVEDASKVEVGFEDKEFKAAKLIG